MPLYDWQERVAEIAMELCQDDETMTFDKLADGWGRMLRRMECRRTKKETGVIKA